MPSDDIAFTIQVVGDGGDGTQTNDFTVVLIAVAALIFVGLGAVALKGGKK